MKRRDLVIAGAGALAILTVKRRPRISAATERTPQEEELAAIERRVGGRLGVAALDVGTGRRLGYRADERFPMCSTFKWLLVARVLSRVDASEEKLSRILPYGPDDLLEYAPVTRAHVGEGGMSLAALCAAAIERSDNTAANLLLATVGGPSGLTSYLRTIGDSVTRLDRVEPALNGAVPGDPRDTTTPAAMLGDLRSLLVEGRLAADSRDRLLGWLAGNTTGDGKLRAGLPAGWRVGDKTGMGEHGATNDVAIAWPDGRAPVLIAAYLTETDATLGARNGALASVGTLVGEWIDTPRDARR